MNEKVVASCWLLTSLYYIVINQQDAAVRSQFYFTAGSLYMFRVLSTPIVRSTLNCIYSLRYRSYYRCSYLLPTWPACLLRYNKTPAELHHAGFIYYNLHDARNHENPPKKFSLFNIQQYSSTKHEYCWMLNDNEISLNISLYFMTYAV